MAISTVYTYDLNGSSKDFNVPFEYLARRFVQVTLVGTDRRVLSLSTDYRFTTKTSIQTTLPWGPGNGYERIEIRRNTSATERLVDFADGSILRSYEMNLSQIQTLHVAEEARNMVADTIAANQDGDLDARGRRLVNLADAISPDHAVTLRQEQTWAQSTLGNRNAAEAAKDRSVVAQTITETKAGESMMSATSAYNSKVSANLSETNAKASEVAAKVSETNAKASEVASKTSETNAKASEVASKGSADRAEGYARSLNVPSIVGNGLRLLRARADESGLEYVDILSMLSDPWFFQPIGVPIPVQTDLGASLAPPTDKGYRYIKLTAGDAYNSGVLVSESTSGAAPLVQSTGVVSLIGSPLNGKTVRLINTERRVLRASETSGEVLQDALQNITAWLGSTVAYGFGGAGYASTYRGGVGAGGSTLNDAYFDASRVARTADETRPKSIGVTYFMRIK